MGEGDKKKLDNKRKQYLKSKLLDFAKKRQEEIVEEIKQKKEKVISERLPVLPNLGDMSEEQIRQLCRELHGNFSFNFQHDNYRHQKFLSCLYVKNSHNVIIPIFESNRHQKFLLMRSPSGFFKVFNCGIFAIFMF